jgi:hypothetical protein
MKNFSTLLVIILTFFLLTSCATAEREEARFISPLDGISLGMTRREVERRLPLHTGTWQTAALFSSLLGIKESTLTNRGLHNLYLYNRKDGSETRLHAAVREFSASQEQRLLAEARQRYGKEQSRRWQPSSDIRIEIEPIRNKRIKVIYDTESRHEGQ